MIQPDQNELVPNPYELAGVNYRVMDPGKIEAQGRALRTAKNLERFGFKLIAESIGEPATVIDMGDFHLAFTMEGLGTKNLILDDPNSGFDDEQLYYNIGKSSVAVGANDNICVGAQTFLIGPHWGTGENWFTDKKHQALIDGWCDACDEVGAFYGGGETSMLKGLMYSHASDLSGAFIGIIRPKEQLTLGQKLEAGDHIVLVESSGIHDNGLTLARKVGSMLPDRYHTRLPSGLTYGEALLKPTLLYAGLQKDLFEAGVGIHYMANVTGHGWRKLMRAGQSFTYRMHTIPDVPEEIQLIQETANLTDTDMFETFNNGAGFAFYVSSAQAALVQEIAKKRNFMTWDAGIVEEGPKQVIIEPKGIIFSEDTLQIR